MKSTEKRRTRMPVGKRIAAILLAAVILFTGTTASAYTVTTTGNTAFNEQKSSFENAKNPLYNKETVSISGRIASAYKQDIYHYKAPTNGYYAIYTTGSSDTVGALYRKEGGLLSQAKYVQRAYNDDPYAGVHNFSFAVQLDRVNDYYVAVRCFGAKTGYYTLKIQPNEDLLNKQYGTWKSTYIPDSKLNEQNWTSKRVYLSKEQALLYYWSLNPNRKITNPGKGSYHVSELQREFKNRPTTAYNFVISAIATLAGIVNPALTLPSAIASFIIAEGITYVSAKNSLTREKMEDLLYEKCGIYDEVISERTTYWHVSKGLLAIQKMHISKHTWTYESYIPGSTQLKGEKWYLGKWTW